MFIIFKPFTYVDNDKSKIVCNNNGASFDAGPNYIYTLDQSLDGFNDVKARKLCEFNTIRDYIQAYKTPSMNYQFKPVYTTNSSWGDALLMTLITFVVGTFAIEIAKKRTALTFLFLAVFIFLSYFLYFQKNALKIFCQRQIAEKVVNFRNSAYKGGVIAVPEEDTHIKSLVNSLNKQCLKNEGL
jgi:hypothetical protein